MRAILYLVNGPLAGQEFDVEFVGGPAPVRFWGPDIHRDLVGTYELVSESGQIGDAGKYRLQTPVYRYQCRMDEDFHRVYRNTMKQRVMRETSDLSEKFRG